MQGLSWYTVLEVIDKIKSNIRHTNLRSRFVPLAMAFVAFWAPIIIFSIIAGEVIERESFGFDTAILTWMHTHTSPMYSSVLVAITTIGNVEILGPITLAIVLWLLYRQQRLKALIVTASVAGAAVANIILKLIFHRARPAFWPALIHETGYSFPSGHAMGSAALMLSLILISWDTGWRWPITIASGSFVLLVGISRVYTGVHYPTDIIAGWCVSLAWVIIVFFVARGASHHLHANGRSGGSA